MKLKAVKNGRDSQTIADELATIEQQQAQRIGELAALKDQLDAANDDGNVQVADDLDRRVLLLRREAEAGNRRIAALSETLNETREQEALGRKRAFVENVAKLAATGREKALRRAALSEELRQLTVEISAICGVVREANEVGRGIGLARIGDPTAGIPVGLQLFQDAKAQHAIAVRTKALREAAAA